MGAGASTQVAEGTTGASNADVEAALKNVGKDGINKIQSALDSIHETAKPTVWISSSGLPSHDLKCKFIATILRKRGVFDEKDLAFPADMPSDETLSEGLPEDATEKAKQLEEKKWSLTREAMVKKYAETLAVCKQVHIMDALFFRDHSVIKGWRGPPTNPDKAEEMFYWDDEIIKDCGFKVENVTIVCMNMKPWIFEDDGLFPADAGDNAGKPHHMWSKQDPKAVHGLDAVGGDEKANYMAKLQQCKDVYGYLKSKPDPVVLPKLESGKSQADELCEASTALNIKYKDHSASAPRSIRGPWRMPRTASPLCRTTPTAATATAHRCTGTRCACLPCSGQVVQEGPRRRRHRHGPGWRRRQPEHDLAVQPARRAVFGPLRARRWDDLRRALGERDVHGQEHGDDARDLRGLARGLCGLCEEAYGCWRRPRRCRRHVRRQGPQRSRRGGKRARRAADV